MYGTKILMQKISAAFSILNKNTKGNFQVTTSIDGSSPPRFQFDTCLKNKFSFHEICQSVKKVWLPLFDKFD